MTKNGPVVFDFWAGGFLGFFSGPVVFWAGGPEILYLTLLMTDLRSTGSTLSVLVSADEANGEESPDLVDSANMLQLGTLYHNLLTIQTQKHEE